MSINLNGIKTTIQSILNTANTTTASPTDLSVGLEDRIKEVMTVNPDLIPIDTSRLPAVTIWIDSKSVIPDTIAATQLAAKRKAKVRFKIAGAVFRSLITDYRTDLADDEAAILMENIEEILRGNPNLSGTVSWQFPSDINYYTRTQEETMYRVGIMDLDAVVHY